MWDNKSILRIFCYSTIYTKWQKQESSYIKVAKTRNGGTGESAWVLSECLRQSLDFGLL
jgi:hypothetical protein